MNINPSQISPASLVLHEDENVLVINKPAGISMHKTSQNDTNVTINDIFADKLATNDPIRGGIVHRLDKDTSGVVILAKNTKALQFLQKQFADRLVDKTYIALVWGHLKHPKARIELPIKRSPKAPNLMSIRPGGRMSVSGYELLEQFNHYSLLKIKLHTGRTHQIRVQFAYMGHPVVGDGLYGSKKCPSGLDRQFLHASSLGLKLPFQQVVSTFEAPLANDLDNFLKGLDG